MPRSSSGRILIEVEPELKNDLYDALKGQNLTVKDWFIGQAQEAVSAHIQPSLFVEESNMEEVVKSPKPNPIDYQEVAK